MAKAKTIYICSICGCESPKWYGKCPDCGEWNSMQESVKTPEIDVAKRHIAPSVDPNLGPVEVHTISELVADEGSRYHTGIAEFDRAVGGGIVKGSVTLLSGDPGIGKSTILLQICAPLCRERRVMYVSGEESARQIKIRAKRLGVDSQNLLIACITQVGSILSAIRQYAPDVVIVDSIQTIYLPTLNSSAGTVSQIRESTQLLMSEAKSSEIPLFLVGHVNKDGAIAGPKVLEHMVDTVLYFEGERNLSFRILRAVKNRFGSTNEIGVFRMGQDGLEEVGNPSFEMISGRPENVSGSSIAAVMEGSRPILAEVQALVCKTSFTAPRRVATGFDFNRMALIVAVLEKRCGYFLGNLDAYINVVGGLRLDEPAADLAVAMSLISNLIDKPVPPKFAMFGEVGLTGEIRPVSHAEQRINEAARLGFDTFIVPKSMLQHLKNLPSDINLIPATSLTGAFSAVFGGSGR